MSILRGDFSPIQAAAVDGIAERTGLSFAAVVRMLLDDGLSARNGYRNGSDSLLERENHYKERDSWEGEGDLFGGDPSNEELPIPVPQSSGRARRRARKSVAEPPAFTEFYDEIYPRKEKRPKALAAWLKAEKEGVLPSNDVLRTVVAQQIDEKDWANPEKAQFIPLPASWINQHSWNDKPLRGAALVKPKLDPEAIARADHKAARDQARREYEAAAHLLVHYPGSTDNWIGPATSWLYDGLDALQEPSEFEARLTHARALIERLRALGAFPLAKAPAGTSPGLIFPACGGGPWRPKLEPHGWGLDVNDLSAKLQAAHKLTASPCPAELVASAEDIRHYLDDFKAGFDRGPVGSEEFDGGVAAERERRLLPTALTPAMVGSGPGIDKAGRPLPEDPYGPWKAGNPNWPVIDDPVSPNPPSDEKILAAYRRQFDPSDPLYPAGRERSGDILLIDGDPVSREAIEHNYGDSDNWRLNPFAPEPHRVADFPDDYLEFVPQRSPEFVATAEETAKRIALAPPISEEEADAAAADFILNSPLGEEGMAKCPRCGAIGEVEAEKMCWPGVDGDECPMTWATEWPLAGSTGDPNCSDGYDMIGDDTPLEELRDDWDDEGINLLRRDRSEP